MVEKGRIVKVSQSTHTAILISFSVARKSTLDISWASSCETCLMSYTNNKGADQTAHPRSLISTFVVHCLDSMICILAISKVSRF